MALNRPLLTVVAAGSLALILSGLGGLLWLLLRTESLAQRLIRDAHALERTRYPRPAHVPSPTPGTFAEALAPLMPDVLRASSTEPRLTGELASRCRAASDAQQGAAPPAECLQYLERDRALLHRALAATHAQQGGLPEDLGIFAAPSHHDQSEDLAALLYLMRLAALDLRLRLAEGQVEAALDTCLDALALGREASLGGGLEGRMVSTAGHDVCYLPCAAALAAAPPALVRQVAPRLEQLRTSLPPYSHTLREESLSLQLSIHAHLFLSPEEHAALPPLSARLASQGPGGHQAIDGWMRLVLRRDWRQLVTTFDALLASADRPFAERRRALTTLATRLDASSWLAERLDLPPTSYFIRFHAYQEYSERVEGQRLQVAALATLAWLHAARAEQGRWPDALPAPVSEDFTLEAPSATRARLVPREATFAGLALELGADGPAASPPQSTPAPH